ncbi:MAG: hypothetical protein IH892_08340 [Planctomycetes bacterium]|nr:hypothetical protein [Planctomycetota bacterium]
MRLRDLLVWCVCAVVFLALIWAAGSHLAPLTQLRVEAGMVMTEVALENAPPSLAFATVAMGAFRGLVVDILWMRADNLKEQGKFFDAKQLAEWIATLQPRFASVWEFQAWNMAYNISVAIPASQPDQRWRWVKNGYELLRDKGIHYNPKAIELYREIGRIFQHKMGGISDEAQKYYKIQFAKEIGPLVGNMPSAFYEEASKLSLEWDDLVADPNVLGLLEAFHAADAEFAVDASVIEKYFALLGERKRFKPELGLVYDRYRETEAMHHFDTFARAYQLKEIWKMDVDLMRELNERLGPVDFEDPNRVITLNWLHPDAHAIYWAYKGLDLLATEEGREKASGEVNTDRIIAHSLQNLFRYGQTRFFPNEVYPILPDGSQSEEPQMQTDLFLRPDLRMFDRYHQAALDILEKYQDDRGRRESLANGHRNMLINAVFSFYQAGHTRQAERIYTDLRERYPRPEFDMGLVPFCRKRFLEEMDSIGIPDAREQILFLLQNSYSLFAIGSDDEAYGRESLARQIYDHYMKEFGGEPNKRLDLPSWKQCQFFAAEAFLRDQAYPAYLHRNFLARLGNERPELLEYFRKQGEKQEKDRQADQKGVGSPE